MQQKRMLLRSIALVALSASGCLWPIPSVADGPDYAIDELLATTTAEAVVQGMDPEIANRIWWLESKGDILAEGAHGELGPWQFKPETWMWLAPQWEAAQPELVRMPYAPHDPYWSTKLAVWALANGFAGHWTTYESACSDGKLPKVLRIYMAQLLFDIQSMGLTDAGRLRR